MRDRWPLLLALWIAISSGVAIIAIFWPDALAADFRVFWTAVRDPNPYSPSAEPFAYPPTALLWFSPLRLVGQWPAFLIWTAVSIAAFLLAGLRLYGRGATALALISPAVPVGLIPGQTSLLASAMLFAAFASDCRLCRGVLLGALLTFKPQLAVMAPLFLIVRRDWTALTAASGAVLALTLITTVMFGMHVWSDWLNAIASFREVVAHRGLSMSAVSPATFATSIGLPSLPLLLLGCAAGVLIAVKSRPLQPPECAAMIATASLFASPYALRYDMVALAPAMAAVILSQGTRKALLACVAYSATFGPLSLAAATCVVDWRSSRAQPVQPS